MGCATSKEKRCRHCKSPYSPVPRSYSMHVHHPPQGKGDSYHMVALTSSTIGSLKLQISNQQPNNHLIENSDHKLENRSCSEIAKIGNHDGVGVEEEKVLSKEQLTMGIIEAKAWSTMIDQKIPKIVPRTPIRTPPGEPETINAWELMEGLEDAGTSTPPHHCRSFSFNVPRSPDTFHDDPPKSSFQQPSATAPAAAGKPLWLQLVDDDGTNPTSGVPEFDPEIIASFRKSLQLIPIDDQKSSNFKSPSPTPPAKEGERVVFYFTSLRGVRKTYEDCCNVRMILRAIGVRVDERDVSMHSVFKEELRELMGDGFGTGALLPRVFVGTKYIGGAEEIRRLHEDGKLEKILDSCQKIDQDGACEGCGDVRFVPCETCSGSCKIYYDIDDHDHELDHDHDDDDEELEGGDGVGEAEEYGFQRCPDCNENGLIRCPLCCY